MHVLLLLPALVIYTPNPYSSYASPRPHRSFCYVVSFLQSAYLTMNDISFYIIVNYTYSRVHESKDMSALLAVLQHLAQCLAYTFIE